MLLIGVLGLIVLGFAVKHILSSSVIQRRDVVLAVVGVIALVIGLYQANRLRHWS